MQIPVQYQEANLYFQDESRFGLHTKAGKGLTAKAVQPLCPFQQVFQSCYLFGAFSPVDGSHFELEMPHCNADTFQVFLDEFSACNAAEYKIVVLDNGAFHKAKSLKVPGNIALLFLPPYSPELNPAEKIWHRLKRDFTNRLFKNLEELSLFISEAIKQLSNDIVITTCSFKYILLDSFWSK